MNLSITYLGTLGSLLANQAVGAQAAPSIANATAIPLTYCTALPRPDFAHWDSDYAQYGHLLTPEIRRTQLGLSFVKDGIHYWCCQPAATPHAQLDTLTRLATPQLLLGHWRSVLVRTVVHRDSAVIGEKRIYRSAELRPASAESSDLTLADGKVTILGAREGGTTTRLGRKRYELVGGRYLLVYGLLKAGGAVSQVGLDAQGRLILHNCAVTERKVAGQYQTYETVLNQAIFERVSN